MGRNNLIYIVVVTSYLLFGHETSLQEEVNFLINTDGRIPVGYEPATILDAVKYRFQLDKALKKENADKFEVRSKYIYAPGGSMPILMTTKNTTGKSEEPTYNPLGMVRKKSDDEELPKAAVEKPGHSEEPNFDSSNVAQNKSKEEHMKGEVGTPGPSEESRSNPSTMSQNMSKVEEKSNVTEGKPGPSEVQQHNMSTMPQKKYEGEGEEKINVVGEKAGGTDDPPRTSSNKSQNVSNVEEHVVVGQEQIDHTGFAWRWTCKKDIIPLRGQSDVNNKRHVVKCIDACHDHCLGYCPHYCCGVNRTLKKCHPYCQRSCPIMYTKPCLQYTECFGLVKNRTNGVYQQHGAPRHTHGKAFRKHKFPKVKHEHYTQH